MTACGRAAGLALVLAAFGGCGDETAPPEPVLVTGSLEAGAVARVAGQDIAAETVSRIAAAKRVGADEALDLAVADAVYAAEAERRGLLDDPLVQARVRGALARALLAELQAEAEAMGPLTEDELARLTERHWLSFDRPESFRTVHAVVRIKSDDAGEDVWERAREAADALRRRVADSAALAGRTKVPPPRADGKPGRDEAMDAFVEAAKGLSSDFEVLAEPLPPVAREGYALTPDRSAFDPAFCAAAAELDERGDLSQPVRTQFGWHVILLLERIAAARIPADERRQALHAEGVRERVMAAKERILAPSRASVEIAADAAYSLGLLQVRP